MSDQDFQELVQEENKDGNAPSSWLTEEEIIDAVAFVTANEEDLDNQEESQKMPTVKLVKS